MYVLGACLGALFFGWLTDRLGRIAAPLTAQDASDDVVAPATTLTA